MVHSLTMTKKTLTRFEIALGIFLVIAVSAFAYTYFQKKNEEQSFSTEKQNLLAEIDAKTKALSEATATIEALTETLKKTEEELDELEDDYREERNKNKDFEEQISDIAGTVGKLDKLSKTDQELLQKYSKVYFLNENYIPSDIDAIDDTYILAGRDPLFFHGDALPFLEDMLDEAKDDGIDLKILSAYRSFDTQTELKNGYTQTYGSGANAFSADQGYSEHQLGTTVDLTTPAINGPYLSFENTEAYEWLLDNAYKYGFTLSYPKDNTFYIFEPWHWRFVGVDLARDLDRADAHFYDWDQRKIDEYLISIFD